MNILYGMNGEGSGHAIRAKPILEHLSKKHNISIIAGGKAYEVINKDYKTTKISYFDIKYNKNKVRPFLTVLNSLLCSPFRIINNILIIKKTIKTKPDLVISDFEPFSHYYALIYKIPLISIDNQNMSIKTEIGLTSFNKYIIDLTIRLISPKADYYLMTSFFNAKIKNDNSFIFPPILRKEFFNLKPKKGKHVLVYLRTENEKIFRILDKINQKFIVYGLDIEKNDKNITSKKFNEKEFIKDLASAKAVICNGGFTVIIEALHLKKPVLSIPFKNQYEQYINAYYINKLGYGKYSKDLNIKDINLFIKNLEYYNNNLKKYKREDNRKIINKINTIIENIKKQNILS
jgi:uncharacterized protein (TIGR00661 family)